MDRYLTETEAVLRQGRDRLDVLAVRMSSAAPVFSVLARRRKLANLEARFAAVTHSFELLRASGAERSPGLVVALEKSLEKFQFEIGWKQETDADLRRL
jgi:hypothetical protein